MPQGFARQQNTSGTPTRTTRKKKSSRGLFLTLVVLILVTAAFGGAKFFATMQEQTLADIEADIEQTKNNFNMKNVSAVVDFRERLEAVETSARQDVASADAVLNILEQAMVPRVVLMSFKQTVTEGEGEIVELTADAESFDLIAQQVSSLRETGVFTTIEVGDTSIDRNGRFIFSVRAQFAPVVAEE